MNPRFLPLAALAGALVACLPAAAQDAAQATPRFAAPNVQRIVTEDDGVRIEELRVRGQTQRIVVQPKGGKAPAYEILPGAGGGDLSPAGPGMARGVAGQRVWSIKLY